MKVVVMLVQYVIRKCRLGKRIKAFAASSTQLVLLLGTIELHHRELQLLSGEHAALRLSGGAHHKQGVSVMLKSLYHKQTFRLFCSLNLSKASAACESSALVPPYCINAAHTQRLPTLPPFYSDCFWRVHKWPAMWSMRIEKALFASDSTLQCAMPS